MDAVPHTDHYAVKVVAGSPRIDARRLASALPPSVTPEREKAASPQSDRRHARAVGVFLEIANASEPDRRGHVQGLEMT